MIRKSTLAVTFKKMLGAAAIGATLCAAPGAQAGVLDFEGYADTLVMDGLDGAVTVGQHYISSYGGGFGLIGNNDTCAGTDVACPRNNATTYYVSAADSYTFVEMNDFSNFKLGSIDASFIGFNGQSYPSVAGLLQVAAFSATNVLLDTVQLALAGPVGGGFNFATYDLSGLAGGAEYSYVRFVSFACEIGSTNCNRTTNQAQFALDNVVTVSASDVPEPGSFALMGLGLFGIGAIARRRKAAAAASI